MVYAELVFYLVLILVAALVFTNALEHLGARMGISEGVTGSLFAAIGTALPETMIPVLALFFLRTGSAGSNQAVGVGAILGAPLLLSTLAMALMAGAVLAKRRLSGAFEPERSGLRRDLDFFLPAYAVVAAALLVPASLRWLDLAIAAALAAWYVMYVWSTVRASAKLVAAGHATAAESPLLLTRVRLPDHVAVMLLQVALGLALLVWGAEGFIHTLDTVSRLWGVPALILSLLIAPLASEMPEKVNSVVWVRRRRDTLAFGNVTGAMVFQGTLLPALGIMATPWRPSLPVVASVVATLAAVVWLRVMLARGPLRVWHMMVNGTLYAAYLALVLCVPAGGG
ncbi:MAG: sodium:calcium antiporter [Rhodanobacteraceae bacterium]|nr:MAG: sodium:calcium antiporter [Rhodanobacteraceae bacterium]